MNLPANTVAPVQLPQPPKPPPFQLQPTAHNHAHLRPVVRWTSSMATLCRDGRLSDAVEHFAQMNLSGIEPSHVTLVTLISACANSPSPPTKASSLGASFHGYARKLGWDSDNVVVGTAVVDMYSKHGHVSAARSAFDGIKVKNLVSWNTMVNAYTRNGEIESAVELFDEMPERDRISWTALIGGFVKSGRVEEALGCFREMQISGVRPDYVTVMAVLTACADLGSVRFGLWMNRFVLNHSLDNNVKINNSLIDMYSRCGCVEFARQVFDKMPEKNLVSWNSMIVGLAINGHVEEALRLFDSIPKEGLKPDGVSFTGALTACSHSGQVELGVAYFEKMTLEHKIRPRIEHYGCLVDLYSRAGRLREAVDVIVKMPMKPNEVVLGSVLAACRSCGDVALAEELMTWLLEVDPVGESKYVLVANMYAAVGRWDWAGKVRRRMKSLGMRKTPGCSSIEIGCDVHEFFSGDTYHADSERLYSVLRLLSSELRAFGYIPENVLSENYDND